MNANDINLDFLYYQRKLVLDGVDPKEEAYKKDLKIFEKLMEKEGTLNKVIQLIILGYKEKYAQHKFYSSCFFDVTTGLDRPVEPDHIGKYDQYMPKEKMVRKDIDHFILRIFKDDYEKTNARYLKEMELVFVEEEDLNSAVEEALKGRTFSKDDSSGKIVFRVDDSPIKEIEIDSKKFVMRINEKKWKAYY